MKHLYRSPVFDELDHSTARTNEVRGLILMVLRHTIELEF